MKCLSLFSGIGGFDLALVRKGHEIVAACEIDKYARTVYARYFPRVPIFKDATKLTGEEFGEIDIICAGFPCQTFSIAGKRLGFEESRGTLFFEIARLARQKRPRLLLLENVKGLLSHDRGKTFANILTTLDELGYDAEWQVLNSKYFVPQNRERIFIIGHLRGTSTRQVFPLGEDGESFTKTRRERETKRKHIQNKIVGCIDANYYKGSGTRTMIVEPKIKSLGSFPIPYRRRKEEPNQKQISTYLKDNKHTTLSQLSEITKIKKTQLEHYFRTDSSGALPNKEEWLELKKALHFDDEFDKIMTEYIEDVITHEMGTRIHDSTGLSPTLTGGEKMITVSVLTSDRIKKRQNGRRFKEDDDESFTLTSQDRHGIFDGKKIRRLTPLECERLQGFPDGYTEGISDTQRYKCLGNAVTVPVIEYILERL